jgi:hypothetical protein
MRRSGIVVILLLQRCRSADPDYPADKTAAAADHQHGDGADHHEQHAEITIIR